MDENELSNEIIGIAIGVHTVLGPGLLENVYKECLFHKINQSGLFVEKEKVMPVVYEDVKLDCGYKIDILVERKLVLELKRLDTLSNVHLAQTLTYLKLGNYKLGLLMNFNTFRLKDGLKRVVNQL
ncbi:GxxExxY protein [Pedobacter frigiditerrae]|uniref:GxxExxY protein n=1 Tax=Pedobacter frigiditerrae TaxID=2530452 RepID=A0A4R0N888_9SPHI|nr:GxxExxY protein [Pedobacter frigiditerrae]TCC94434.1 GxxExxY protein [Pedobacter frigiditerrae]